MTVSGYLVVPEPGERTMATLRRKVRLVAIRTLLTQSARTLRGPAAQQLPAVQFVLSQTLKRAPAAVLDAVGNPDVLTPLLTLAAEQGDATALIEAAVPPLLAGLSVHGVLPEAVVWEVPLTKLVDVRRGQVLHFDPPAKALLADPSGLELLLHDGTRLAVQPRQTEWPDSVTATRPFHPVAGHARQHLSLVDTNPLSMFEAHPDKDGNALSLGDRGADVWVDTIEQALDLVKLSLPTWHDEMPLTQERLVPVGYEPEKHLSATYREAPGILYLTLHPDVVTMAEAIVHETQHTKVNMLSWSDAVLHNAHTTWTASPVRPDLRPLWGVLLAVHAFVPVAVLHARLAEAEHPLTQTMRFAERRAEVLAGNRTGLDIVLEKGQPTPLGQKLVTALSDIQQAMEAIAPPPPRPVAEGVMPPG